MKLFKHRKRSPGSGVPLEDEKILPSIGFNKFKFSNKQPPDDKSKILFITCFSEFGCESIALLYCIPKIIQKFSPSYVVCVGWHGRDYLYRHLVDEFWAVKEEHQWLREYSLAFKSTSKNISNLEASLENLGSLYKGEMMGQICLGNTCRSCNNFWGESSHDCVCPLCKSSNIERGLLNDVKTHKKFAVNIPKPRQECLEQVKKSYLKPKSVGVFARNRVCYGRNLGSNFYIKLVNSLKDRGYNPIWLGERQSILPCPLEDITDFSSTKDSDNLELTLALISQLEFTVQFWTASTRLASMVNIPWILFESPDQIVGNGQEGIRIALTSDTDKKKIVLAQYKNVLEDQDTALKILFRSIDEMHSGNWSDVIGQVDNPDIISSMLEKQKLWR